MITGCHPEYHTLQSTKDTWNVGEISCTLGGNGFYWSIAVHDSNPHRIEVRRGGQGGRTSYQEPGERVHALDGAIGGLWRDRGKAANYLVGIGCCGEGAGPGKFTLPCFFNIICCVADGHQAYPIHLTCRWITTMMWRSLRTMFSNSLCFKLTIQNPRF